MKSPGSNFDTPQSWQPPANMVNQPGQVSPGPGRQQQTPSFLPNNPQQMASGLTPEMVALILGTAPQTLNGQPGAAGDGRDTLASLLTPKTIAGGQVL
jgi:hypothetical protein